MNKPYLITYDLNSPGQKYEKVIKLIKNQLSDGNYYSEWKSAYLLRSNLTPDKMMELIEPVLDSNDSVLIVEINDNYDGFASKEGWIYIRKHILPKLN